MCFRPLFTVLVLILFVSCTKDQTSDTLELDIRLRNYLADASETGDANYYILPSPDDLANIPQDPKNPLTTEKVALGKLLFFETGLAMDAVKASGMGTYSCSSCHLPSAGFRPGTAQGIADGGVGFGFNGDGRVRNTEYREDEIDVQSARPLSLINVAYVTNTSWNGSFGSTGVNVGTEDAWQGKLELNNLGMHGLETQNIDGLDVHRIRITKNSLDQFGYTELFDAAFPDVEEDNRYNKLHASLALSAYLRTVLADEAPFQKWLKGDERAMSVSEKEGAALFFGKARCSNCHFRPNLGSLEFHALGVKDMYQSPSFDAAESDTRNLGRGGFTLNEEDNYKFKVPQLYNMSDAPFFFHGSSKRTLEEVIDYKIEAVSENPNVPNDRLSPVFGPINLTDMERSNLLLFLKTSLRDPNLERHMPTEILSGQCFPNNDPQSIMDLGCAN